EVVILPGVRGTALTLQGKAILLPTGDPALGGDVLGRLAHVPALEGAPQAVVDHRVHRLLVAELPPGPGAEQEVRRAAHALHPGGDDDLGVAGTDGLGADHGCLEARAAHHVDG